MPTPILSAASYGLDPRQGAGFQNSPAVAALEDGRFATVYRSSDSLGGTLRYVIHNQDGTTAFEQAIVDADDDVFVDNEMVNIAALEGGGFVITWSERGNGNENVYHRVYGADGTPLTAKIQTNADMPGGAARRPDVTSDGEGGFYIVWDDMHYNSGSANTRSVRMQHFGADGQPTGDSERISDDIGGDSNAAIAVSRDGTRVNVIWDDDLGNPGNHSDGIYGIEIGGQDGFYRADDGAYSEFHSDPDVAYSTGTTYMAVWNEWIDLEHGYAVYGSINGGAEFKINTMGHTHSNTIQKVVGLRDGNFLVVWTDNGFDGNDDVNGQLMSSTGEKIGEEFRISDTKSNFINRITASETIDGRVIVTWDTPDGGIRGRLVDPRQGALEWMGGSGAEQVTGTIHADTLDGGAGDDVIQGLDGADVIIGGEGTDTATYDFAGGVVASLARPSDNLGHAAGDSYQSVENLRGSGLADTLTGDGKANTLSGQAGTDVLQGGIGDDVLQGGEGKDILSGDAGADMLFGGADSDVFRFGSAKDSPAGGEDRLLDFSRKLDRIDLGRIDADTGRRGDQDFDFIGTSRFQKDAGELRFQFARGDTVVQADTDGDGKADFAFVIEGEVKLTAGMFDL